MILHSKKATNVVQRDDMETNTLLSYVSYCINIRRSEQQGTLVKVLQLPEDESGGCEKAGELISGFFEYVIPVLEHE